MAPYIMETPHRTGLIGNKAVNKGVMVDGALLSFKLKSGPIIKCS